jgi:hypothetical protein
MARNGNSSGPVVVTGPGDVERSAPNFGAGLAYAMHAAGQTDSDRTWYVRGDGMVGMVVRNQDGSVECETRAA